MPEWLDVLVHVSVPEWLAMLMHRCVPEWLNILCTVKRARMAQCVSTVACQNGPVVRAQ